MKFPWRHRADTAQKHRVHAEQRLDRVLADWPRIHEEVAAIRREHELNHWTDTIVSVFGRPAPREQRR